MIRVDAVEFLNPHRVGLDLQPPNADSDGRVVGLCRRCAPVPFLVTDAREELQRSGTVIQAHSIELTGTRQLTEVAVHEREGCQGVPVLEQGSRRFGSEPRWAETGGCSELLARTSRDLQTPERDTTVPSK